MEFEKLKTDMIVGTGGKKTQGWIWTVDTRVTCIPFMLEFLANFFKGASYLRDVNTSLPEHIKYNTQYWYDPKIRHFVLGE